MVNITNARNRGFTNQKPVKRHVVLGVPTEGTVLDDQDTDLNEGGQSNSESEGSEGNDQSPAADEQTSTDLTPVTEESAPVTETVVEGETVTTAPVTITTAPAQSDEDLAAQGFSAEEIAELRASESNS